jgi:hypothetical protein
MAVLRMESGAFLPLDPGWEKYPDPERFETIFFG